MSLYRKMATGALWMGLLRMCDRLLGLLSIAVLARLLSTEDFGILAMAMAVIAALEALATMSFDVALIQRRDVQEYHYQAAWTINIIVWSFCALCLILGAPLAAAFFETPELLAVIPVLALSFFARGFQNVRVIEFMKELQFNREFALRLSERLTYVTVAIVLALLWESYWAMVIGIVAGQVVGMGFGYYLRPWLPRISFKGAWDLIRFSAWLVINNLLFFARQRASHIIIGRVAGASSLGIYHVAFELSQIPTIELGAAVNRAVFPGFAKMAEDLAVLRRGFLDVIGMLALLVVPVAAGMSATSDLVVAVVLGAKWAAAAPVIQLLVLYGAVVALTNSTGFVLYALGRTRLVTIINVAQFATLLGLLIWLITDFGIIGAAYAFLLVQLATVPVLYAAVMRAIELPMRDVLAGFWRPFAAATTMYLALTGGTGSVWFDLPGGALINLIAAVVLGATVYAGVLIGLWVLSGQPDGAERKAVGMALARLRRTPAAA